jgi:glycosyltransferase involved in cell wall biosynthesis
MRIWLDVDDLFYFASRSARPTGIQRLTGELYRALVELEGLDRIKFVIHSHAPSGFQQVTWERVLATYTFMTEGSGSGCITAPAPPPSPPPSGVMQKFNRLLRMGIRGRTSDTTGKAIPTGKPCDSGDDLIAETSASDVLCSFGAPWHDARYAQRVQSFVSATGARFLLLVHDLIPLVRPEFFQRGRAPDFERVLRGSLPLADIILTNSAATARDVVEWCRDAFVPLRCHPQRVPIGTGFARPPAAPLPDGLERGKFVLFVSTIEVRKNHTQAFRVWLRMLREMPRENVPTLVFAGSTGWMTADLMEAVASTNYLDGKLRIIQGADDGVLAALYQECLFTLFLSFYEGWGLPVSDSISFRKVCVASNRSSIPEAGGDYCVYIDPDNTTAAYNTIRRLVEFPDEIQRLEVSLRMAHAITSWEDTAQAVMDSINSLPCARLPEPTLTG